MEPACKELEVDPEVNGAKGERTVAAVNGGSAHEQGRTYHDFENEAYSLPNDDQEVQRLHLQHQIWKLSLRGNLHISPISREIKNAVDIGTGTGIWTLEFAAAHPACKIIGTDLSVKQLKNTTANCTFQIQNANEKWNLPDLQDFVHSRLLIMGVTDWKHYFEQAWNNLKPGGWMEVQETNGRTYYMDDGRGSPDSPLVKWSTLVREAALKRGIDFSAPDRFKEMVEAQGFVNVNLQRFKWPIGSWPKGELAKKIGTLLDEDQRGMLIPQLTMKLFVGLLGWSEQEVLDFLEEIEKERTDSGSPHYYIEMTICSAQKPAVATE